MAELEGAAPSEDDVHDSHPGGHLGGQVWLREHRHCSDTAGVGGLSELENLLRGDVRRAGEYREDTIAGSVGARYYGEESTYIVRLLLMYVFTMFSTSWMSLSVVSPRL